MWQRFWIAWIGHASARARARVCRMTFAITTFEPTRAGEYGIQHYSWLCLNPKEGEDPVLTREVLEIIPRYLGCESVLGIGEQNDDMGAISFMGIIVLSTIATTESINKLNEAVWVCNGNHSKNKSHFILSLIHI